MNATDWTTLIDSLDKDELAFLTANKVLFVPQREIWLHLGWLEAKGERIRRRVDRKLKRLRQSDHDLPIRNQLVTGGGSSRHTAYLERLDSGRLLWQLTNSNRVGCPQLPVSRGRVIGVMPRYAGPLLTTNLLTAPIDTQEMTPMSSNKPVAVASPADLAARIAMTSQLIDTLMDGTRAQSDLVRELQRAVATIERQFEYDRQFSLASNRVQNSKLRKELSTLNAQSAAAQTNLQTALDTVDQQRDKLAALIADQAAVTKSKALTKLGDKGREFAQLMERAANLAEAIEAESTATGVTYGELFSQDQADFTLRWRQAQYHELLRYKREANCPWLVKGAA